jgi:phospholipid-binding lipoprotein MlaA
MKKHSFSILFNSILLIATLQLVGCSTIPVLDPNAPPPLRQVQIDEDREYLIDVSDPLEGYNRGAYKFNYGFDKYLFIPVVRTYEFILPNYAEDRVSSFFNNVTEFKNFYNNLLQGKFKATGVTVGRFAVNTTVGVVGLWDPATHWGMERKKEDFGQTLGHWGVGKGAFVVIPVLGPSNARDGVGTITDIVVDGELGPISWIDDETTEFVLSATRAVDTRHKIKFRYQQSGSPFEYELIRMFYSMKRDMDVAN